MSAETTTSDTPQVLQKADDLMGRGQHGQALELLQEALSHADMRAEDTARLQAKAGACLTHMKRLPDAAAAYRKALELFESQNDTRALAEATEQFGIVQHQRRGYQKDAMEAYRKAERLWKSLNDTSGRARAIRLQGDLQVDLGERNAALDSFNEARKLYLEIGEKDGIVPCITATASLLFEQSGRAASIAEYQRGLTEDGVSHFLLYNNLGFLQTLENALPEAREALQKGLEDAQKREVTNDDLGLLHLNLANVDHLEGRLSEAEAHYQKCSTIFDQDPLGRAIEIVVLPAQAPAETELSRFVIADDGIKRAVTRANIASLRVRQGKLDEALAEATAAVDQDPNLAYPYATLGWVHMARQEADAATAAFRKAVSKEPNNADYRKALELSNPYLTGKVGRNDPCPCGSGKKFKKCHGG